MSSQVLQITAALEEGFGSTGVCMSNLGVMPKSKSKFRFIRAAGQPRFCISNVLPGEPHSSPAPIEEQVSEPSTLFILRNKGTSQLLISGKKVSSA